MLPTKFRWQPCLLTDRYEMCNLYRGPSIDASYQISLSFGQAVSEKIFKKSANQKQELPVVAMFVSESEQNEQSLQRTFQGCSLPYFNSFGQAVSEIFQISTNQKQELPVAAMFVNGSGRKEESLQRTCHRCFLPSFGSFGQAVSEKILKKSPNQKQEFPMVAMFVNGSG